MSIRTTIRLLCLRVSHDVQVYFIHPVDSMPIAVLPQDTIRAIGASQVLTDSSSAIKELVDNALDANASAIFVEVSANTLDVIQVRDNGFGVAPADRSLVCKRYCTSKITSFEEVSTIGGQCLGFRGEALASAAEMSGSLVISTRIEGEATAVCLRVNRQGAIERCLNAETIPRGLN